MVMTFLVCNCGFMADFEDLGGLDGGGFEFLLSTTRVFFSLLLIASTKDVGEPPLALPPEVPTGAGTSESGSYMICCKNLLPTQKGMSPHVPTCIRMNPQRKQHKM